jgi:hypothetical protein
MNHLLRPRLMAAAAMAAGLFGVASAAHARSDVQFSIGLGVPIYAQPAYVQPEPVYIQPEPVYVQPQPAYVAPGVVYARPGYGWRDDEWRRDEWRRRQWAHRRWEERREWEHHHRRDRDWN